MSIHKKPEKIVDLLLARLNETKVQAVEYVTEEEQRNDLISKLEVIESEIQSLHYFSSRIRSIEESIKDEFIEVIRSIDSDALKYPDKLDHKLKVLIQDISKIKESLLSSELPVSESTAQHNSLQQQQQQQDSPQDRVRSQRRSQLEDAKVLTLHRALSRQRTQVWSPRIEWSRLWPQLKDAMTRSAMETFQASYHSLKNFKLKLCLLCFSIFPEKSVIKKRPMIYWWMAEGLVTSDTEGDDIFQDLMNKRLILPNEEENESPVKNSCKFQPWLRRVLISVAKEVKLFNFDDDEDYYGIPSYDERRAFFLLGNQRLFRRNSNSIKEESLDMVFNLNENYLSFHAEWLLKLKKVKILQLGRWQVSPKHHIEIKNDESLNGLRTQKHLKYLSLRGISRITKLPPSITELISLKILDLRACHNLEKLPPDISMLKNLTHLDISECYLLERMPRGLDRLSALLVLKGFVVGNSKNASCQLNDLTQLKKLFKLSVYIRAKAIFDGKEFEKLEEIKSLRKLTISWGKDSKETTDSRFSSISFPEDLQKLDLRCLPGETIPQWLDPCKLLKLEKLYIRGGSLNNFSIAENNEWSFKILRLRHLKSLTIGDLGVLRKRFPRAKCFDIGRCSDDQADIFWNKNDEDVNAAIRES